MIQAPSALAQPDVAWEPTERQREFLASPDWEVLYGGAVGRRDR
jgi:hypothetical protein